MKKFIGVLLFLGMTPPLMAMDAPELSIRPSSERWRESAEKIDEYSYRYKNAARNIQAAMGRGERYKRLWLQAHEF